MPWDEVVSQVLGYPSRRAWRRIMGFDAQLEATTVFGSVFNGFAFILRPSFQGSPPPMSIIGHNFSGCRRVGYSSSGWSHPVVYTGVDFHNMIGGALGCAIAVALGAARNTKPARIMYAEHWWE